MALQLPVETRGRCVGCGNNAILGDGFCADCWDGKTLGSPAAPVNSEYAVVRNKHIYRLHNAGLGYAEIAGMYGLRKSTVKTIICKIRRENGGN